MENLYQVLNCAEDSSVEILKKAYLELALKHHPDKNQGEGTKFIQIKRAWDVLSDDFLRQEYDTRWKERCLAQSYPIQDTVHFEEFDFVETPPMGSEAPPIVSQCPPAGRASLPSSSEAPPIDSEAPPINNEAPPCNTKVEQDGEYHYECRCGGVYILTQTDVRLKFDIVCCDTCSLSISVLYDDDDTTQDMDSL